MTLINKVSYSDKLRDPRWQKKRLEILERDEFKCQLCGDAKTELHIHHLSYKRGNDPWEYDNTNLVSYCKHCHALVEYHKQFKNTLINVSKKQEGDVFYLTSILTLPLEDRLYFSIESYKGDGVIKSMFCSTRGFIEKVHKMIKLAEVKISEQ